VDNCISVGFNDAGSDGVRAARVARWFVGLEMIGISRIGAKSRWRVRLISLMLLGTTTTRFVGSLLADGAGVTAPDDRDAAVVGASRKALGAP